MKIKIDGEIYNIEADVIDCGLPLIRTEEGEEFYLAKDSEEAGKEARDYWENLAQDDPKEFTCIVGEQHLINWGLGMNSAPGSIGVDSLEEWLDLWLDVPAEHWASYDGEERTVDRCGHLIDEIGFTPTVAYRAN